MKAIAFSVFHEWSPGTYRQTRLLLDERSVVSPEGAG